MALSNWDTLTINQDGDTVNGLFTSPLGVTVEFYKNWLYVHDPKAWQGGPFGEPVVMRVEEGELQYRDVSIIAKRGPQEGVFALIHSGFQYNRTFSATIGCGVYGYDDEGDFTGVQEESIKFLKDFLADIWKNEVSPYSEPPSLQKALRFNQGDAFFASETGKELPTTTPGEAEEPIIMKLL